MAHAPAPPVRPSALARLRRARATMPLAWKLALLTTALLVAGMGGLLFAVHAALVDGAEELTRTRLTRVVQDLAQRTVDGQRPRDLRMQQATQRSEVRAALRTGDSTAIAVARDTLAAMRLHARDTIGIELWDARGRPLATIGDSLTPALRTEQPPADMPVARAWYGSIRQSPHGAHVWAIVPVDEGGRRLGYVARIAWFRAPRTLPQQLRTLTGYDVTLALRNADGTAWTTASGEPVRVPDRRDSTSAGVSYWRGSERSLAMEAAVAGTPWVVVIEGTERALLAGPRDLMRRLLLLALAIAAVGAAIAWRIGRRITRPLSALTSAAEDVARGTYEHQVPSGSGGNEVDRLTTTFDVMARKVGAAQVELQRRAADAQEYAAELARANARLQDAITDAERASRAKSDFLAVMSHELRTPLNAIGGYAELIGMGIYGEVGEAQRDALERIGRSQRHLLSLIDDVLSFARLEGGQTRFDVRDVPLQEAIAGIEALVAPQAHARRLTLEVPTCPPSLAVRADPDKLRQIMLNLVANAIKFTPERGLVRLTWDADEREVRLHVTDTGAGIPEERHGAIFEPFVQGDRALNRPTEGVGLGLAISRDLAHAMGGRVSVQSAPGQGSTFTLALPRAGVAPSRDVHPTSEVPDADGAASSPLGR